MLWTIRWKTDRHRTRATRVVGVDLVHSATDACLYEDQLLDHLQKKYKNLKHLPLRIIKKRAKPHTY